MACRAPSEADAGEDRHADEAARFKASGRRNVDGVVRFGDRTMAPSAVDDAGSSGGVNPAVKAEEESGEGDDSEGQEEDVPMELSTEADAPHQEDIGTVATADDDVEDEPEPPGTSATSAGSRTRDKAAPDVEAAATGASKEMKSSASTSSSSADPALSAEAAAERWRQLWARVPCRWDRTLHPEAAADDGELQDQQQQQRPPGYRRQRVEFDVRTTYEGGGHKIVKAVAGSALPEAASKAAAAAGAKTPSVSAIAASSAAATVTQGASRQVSPEVSTPQAPPTVRDVPAATVSPSAAAMAVPGSGGRVVDAAVERTAAAHRPLGEAGKRAAAHSPLGKAKKRPLGEAAAAAAAAEPVAVRRAGSEEETEATVSDSQGISGRSGQASGGLESTGGRGRQEETVDAGLQGTGSRGGQEGAGGRRTMGPSTAAAKRSRIEDGSLSGTDARGDIGFAHRRTSPWIQQTGTGLEAEAKASVGSETGAGAVVGSETGAGAGSVGVPRASPPPPQLLVDEAGEGEAVDHLPQQLLPSLPRRTLPAPWLLRDTSGGGGGGGTGSATAAGSSSDRPPLLPTALMGADMALLDQLLPAISAANSAGGSAVGGAAVGGAAVGAGEGGLLPRLLQGLSALQVRDEGG